MFCLPHWCLTRRANRSPISWDELLSNTVSNRQIVTSVTYVITILPNQSSPTLDGYIELVGDWASEENPVRTHVVLKQRDVRLIYLKSYSSHNFGQVDLQSEILVAPMSETSPMLVVCTCVSFNCRSASFMNQYGARQPGREI